MPVWAFTLSCPINEKVHWKRLPEPAGELVVKGKPGHREADDADTPAR